MAEEETSPEEATEASADGEAAPAERQLPEPATLASLVEPYLSTSWLVADDEWVVSVESAEYHALVTAAKGAGFDTFIDLCAVDYFRRDPRFEIVLTLLDYITPMRLRVRVGVDGAVPQLATVSDVFPGANFYEREAYDLFGIEFIGHPDLTRILLPDDWVGHPLRKDYAIGSVPIQFKESHKAH